MSTSSCQVTAETTGPSRPPRQHMAPPVTVPAKRQAKSDQASALPIYRKHGNCNTGSTKPTGAIGKIQTVGRLGR